jgi:signal transduction histidine kinase
MSAVRKVFNSDPAKRSLLRAYSEFAGEATSRWRTETRLNAARIDAEFANRAKSEFIANMSHDLRTPLNAIIGFSEVLALTEVAQNNPAKSIEYANDIGGAGRHLLGIINDMLDIARLESGAPVVDLENCDLNEIVSAARIFVDAQAQSKCQTIVMQCDPKLPPVLVDPLRIKQIVINLVSNAVKFTPVGGNITVETDRTRDGGFTIRVSDNGPGMNEAELQRALSRFGQVRNASTRGQEGAGLGLTIVKMLSEAQGGRFELSSQPGAGTCASIVFPRSGDSRSQS